MPQGSSTYPQTKNMKQSYLSQLRKSLLQRGEKNLPKMFLKENEKNLHLWVCV